MKTSSMTYRIVFLTGLLSLSACQTISMPKLDLVKSAEFSEDAANIPKSFPRAVDAPTAPDDVRSDGQWDLDAKALQNLRNGSPQVVSEPALTAQDTDRMFEALKDKAQAYKKDDPARETDANYPPANIKRRRN